MELKEQKFWRNELRDGFKAWGHVCRVESHQTSPGIPDVDFQPDFGPHWWIELKVVTGNAPIRFKPRQWPWIRRRWAAGGNCMVLVKWDRPPHSPLYLVNTGQVYNEKDPSQWLGKIRATMSGGIDWNLLKEILCKNAKTKASQD